MRIIIGLIFLLSMPGILLAQKKSKNKNTTLVNFEEVWVWQYKNKEGNQGELAIYRNAKTGYWLFTQEAYGSTGEMIEWVIGKPNGDYVFCYQDPEMGSGKKNRTEHIDFNEVKDMFYKPLSNKQIFGVTELDLGYPPIEGQAFQSNSGDEEDATTYYIGTWPNINMYPVYYFNHIGGDANLPVQFPTELPSDKVVVSQVTKIDNTMTTLHFMYVSSTEYYVEVPN